MLSVCESRYGQRHSLGQRDDHDDVEHSLTCSERTLRLRRHRGSRISQCVVLCAVGVVSRFYEPAGCTSCSRGLFELRNTRGAITVAPKNSLITPLTSHHVEDGESQRGLKPESKAASHDRRTIKEAIRSCSKHQITKRQQNKES